MNHQTTYLERIIEQMVNYSQLDFDESLEILEDPEIDELIPGLAVSVNILGEELQHKVKELHSLNEELENRNSFIKSITDSVPEIIYVCNIHTNQITYVNKCASSDINYSCPVLVMNKPIPCGHCTIPAVIIEAKKNSLIEIINVNEIKIVSPDQITKWYKTTTNDFETDSSGNLTSVLKTLSDITPLKEKEIQLIKKEEALTASLKEKELLLQEVHHRVKNNLQVISGLLTLQINRATSDEVVTQLSEIRNRILSISLIHEELYQQDNLSQVDVSRYCVKLSNTLTTIYANTNTNVKFDFDIEPHIFWSIDKATPLGLIINEVICNCYKHAFKDYTEGIIWVKFSASATDYILKIKDNGEGFSLKKERDDVKKTLGSKLIRGLVMQLEGNMQVSTEDGYEVAFTIPKAVIN